VLAPVHSRMLLGTTLFAATFGGQAVRNAVGWPGYLAIVTGLFVAVLILVWQNRDAVVRRHLPLPLIGFLAISALSLLWSHYQWATLLGLMAQWATALSALIITVTLTWREVVRALGIALTGLLAASLAFEGAVAFVIRHPVAPAYLHVDASSPGAFWWSENHLLELGPIQGVVGNRNLLAFLALLALIVAVTTAIERKRASRLDLTAIALALPTLALTRSATVVLAGVAVAMVAGVLVAIRRTPPRRRGVAYTATGGFLLIVGLAGIASAHSVLSLLGRTDVTGRSTIWRAVAYLAEQQPVLGWGWISYWAPWIPPYRGLITIDGVGYLQAHNALLDIWLQLGPGGVLIALAAAVSAALGAWRWAMGPSGVRVGSAAVAPRTAPTALPLLLLTALLFQSLTESRLLIEGNWLLFVALCCTIAAQSPRVTTAARRLAGRSGADRGDSATSYAGGHDRRAASPAGHSPNRAPSGDGERDDSGRDGEPGRSRGRDLRDDGPLHPLRR
jgi:exopolysaccharide production protein ExoQ